MIDKIKGLLIQYKEIVLYVFFGGLTTLVNFVVYLGLKNLFGVPMVASNIIAWVVSVLFAYVTNKIYVFESKDTSPRAILRELFLLCGRPIFSGVVDTGMLCDPGGLLPHERSGGQDYGPGGGHSPQLCVFQAVDFQEEVEEEVCSATIIHCGSCL